MPPVLDMERIKDLAATLRDRALTIQEIQDHSGISRRTAYRWIETLETQGQYVVRRKTAAGFAFKILP